MTLTCRAIHRARRILWIVTGSEKADALKRLRGGDVSMPGGRVCQDQALLLADCAAARQEPIQP